ncbi:MAG: 4Fe-4S binding protein [Desulfobacteraceae bacterium]|jgi:NAD-dependent dihydropyrimidine dehydrogenase PreA subunit
MLQRADMTGYHRLAVRLNRFPLGAPLSKELFDILTILFSEREAQLVSVLPIRVFTAEKAARAWKLSISETRKMLNHLCRKALLVDIFQNGLTRYCLPPPMAGFFEFSLMRRRTDIDQQLLAELFYRYINMEEDFAKALFADGHTQLGRVFVDKSQIPKGRRLEVLDHELAAQAIGTAEAIGISRCYCREKMEAVGRGCDAPQDICMTLNITGASLIRHGHARRVGVREAMEILETAQSLNMVQFGENVQRQVNFICNCCKCCCEGMIAARRFAMYHPVNTTNFIATIDPPTCSRCGQCTRVCPVDAIALSTDSPRRAAHVNADICLGCGVCARACPTSSIVLRKRPRRVVTPVNTAHRVVLMAIERNKLQDIIFDNQVLSSHRALAALLGAIFRLPPVQRVLAGKQLRSRYLETLIDRLSWQPNAISVPDEGI